MSLYTDWGYISNPFEPNPIEPTEKGVQLLVGRTKEKKKLKNRLKNYSGIITVEGENGIGKTSLINACIYELYEETTNSLDEAQFYIPCNKIVQISSKKNLSEFIDEFYFLLAKTLIDKQKEVKKKCGNLKSEKLKFWYDSPMMRKVDDQIVNFENMNKFALKGFKENIKKVLSEIFPNSESGGVICIMDNMELLETSNEAKRILEYLRDEILNIPQLKWFFSGSHDIFRTFIATPRLSGFIQSPIKIEKLHSINILSILNSRIKSYQNHIDDKPYCPIIESDFVKLFESLNGNLREVFKRLSNFYLHVYEDYNEEPDFDSSKNIVFEKWFENDTNLEFDAVKNTLQKKEISLLRLISSQETILITNKELDNIGIDSISSLRIAISNLEKYGLIYVPILESELIDQEKYSNRTDLIKNIFLLPKSHYIKRFICK